MVVRRVTRRSQGRYRSVTPNGLQETIVLARNRAAGGLPQRRGGAPAIVLKPAVVAQQRRRHVHHAPTGDRIPLVGKLERPTSSDRQRPRRAQQPTLDVDVRLRVIL